MMSVQDDAITFSENDYRVSPTQHTSEDLSSRSEPVSNMQEHSEPTTAEYLASITGSDSPQAQDHELPQRYPLTR